MNKSYSNFLAYTTTTMGIARLVMGNTFSWWDILAYNAGIVVAYLVDSRLSDK
ncbi:MAG: DUF2809 domain-containing protein [Cyclobacteriaceae bacterium]